MCNVCGKIMWDNNLKRHIRLKHNNTMLLGDKHQQQENVITENRYDVDDENESHAAESRFEESDDSLVDYDGVNIKLELHRDNEVYQKNVEIGKQISTLLRSDNIPEKPCQGKTCFV